MNLLTQGFPQCAIYFWQCLKTQGRQPRHIWVKLALEVEIVRHPWKAVIKCVEWKECLSVLSWATENDTGCLTAGSPLEPCDFRTSRPHTKIWETLLFSRAFRMNTYPTTRNIRDSILRPFFYPIILRGNYLVPPLYPHFIPRSKTKQPCIGMQMDAMRRRHWQCRNSQVGLSEWLSLDSRL